MASVQTLVGVGSPESGPLKASCQTTSRTSEHDHGRDDRGGDAYPQRGKLRQAAPRPVGLERDHTTARRGRIFARGITAMVSLLDWLVATDMFGPFKEKMAGARRAPADRARRGA